MLFGTEAEGQNLRQSPGLKGILRAHHVDQEVIFAEFPHPLAAHTARGERAGDLTAFAAADTDKDGEISQKDFDTIKELVLK